jgi:aspartate-semialdehyde dehydrogenase
MTSNRLTATVLGATGVVGQRFVKRLAAHPAFELRHVAASSRSAGLSYGEACDWRLAGEPYAGFDANKVVPCDPEHAMADVVFSALDSAAAREIEPRFAAAGAFVFSNASAFRMADDVPLLVPEVNPEHLALIEVQRRRRGFKGAIVCNPNCTATVLTLALAPLHAAFGVEAVAMTSMQAVSGAGYPGVASLDIIGNVIPYIRDEEDKVAEEVPKMLGRFAAEAIEPLEIPVSAQCHRVAVIDGHVEAIAVRLTGDPDPDEVAAAFREWRSPATQRLFSAPEKIVRVHAEFDRPQPRRDVDADAGMSLHVGRIRRCPILGIKFTALSHNAERGAAGGSMLNAELASSKGLLA